MKLIVKQASRFLIVGFTAAGIDFAIYRFLLFVEVPVPFAKALGFIGAGTFAYFANRSYTFSARGSLARFVGCCAVYAVSIGLNVGINSGILALVGLTEPGIILAFVVASAVSATTNFLGMKYFIFTDSAVAVDSDGNSPWPS